MTTNETTCNNDSISNLLKNINEKNGFIWITSSEVHLQEFALTLFLTKESNNYSVPAYKLEISN